MSSSGLYAAGNCSDFQYPISLEETIRLPNDLALRIRPLRRCEMLPIRDLFSHLSPRSRYLRFSSPLKALPESMLRLLTCVDYRRRLGLLAEVETATGAVVVGLGNYGATDDDTAEVALMVRDDWQGLGIGTTLAARVMQAAEARGFDRFVAHVHWENMAIRRLLKHVDLVSTQSQGGVSEVSFVRRR